MSYTLVILFSVYFCNVFALVIKYTSKNMCCTFILTHHLHSHCNLSQDSRDNISINLTFVSCSEQILFLLRFIIATSKDARVFLVKNNKSEYRINHTFFCLKFRNIYSFTQNEANIIFLFLQGFWLLRNFVICFDRTNTAK